MSPETNIVDAISQALRLEGYECTKDVSLGPAQASLCASRKVRCGFLPYSIHYYIFDVSCTGYKELDSVFGLNALARDYTDRYKHKRSRWFRLRVPITATVIISPSGFSDIAVNTISKWKPRYQMGDVNSVLLVDSRNQELHSLRRTGFLGCIPLKYITRQTSRLLKAASVL